VPVFPFLGAVGVLILGASAKLRCPVELLDNGCGVVFWLSAVPLILWNLGVYFEIQGSFPSILNLNVLVELDRLIQFS